MIVARRPIAAQKCNKMAQLNINKTEHFDQSNTSESQTAVKRRDGHQPQNCHKHFALGLICPVSTFRVKQFLRISSKNIF